MLSTPLLIFDQVVNLIRNIIIHIDHVVNPIKHLLQNHVLFIAAFLNKKDWLQQPVTINLFFIDSILLQMLILNMLFSHFDLIEKICFRGRFLNFILDS